MNTPNPKFLEEIGQIKDPKAEAIGLAKMYAQHVAAIAGIYWTQDNDADIEALITLVIAAAKAEIKAEETRE